jgi:aryl-alcohol dehydrogenase-like predicted oxidoreductase
MRYRVLGRTGLKVPEIGFGGAPLGINDYLEEWDTASEIERQSGIAALRRALELGVTYWDTAPGYGDGMSESIMGVVLPECRNEVTIATKVGGSWTHDAVMLSAEESLRRLKIDCIDVFQFHGGHYTDGNVDDVLGGGMDAMKRLREQGKIRFIGLTAEGSTGPLERIVATGELDTLQIRYNFCYQHTCDYVNDGAGIVHQAESHGMGIVTMRTLTSGLFQGTMRKAFPGVADSVDLDEFCLNYVLSNPLVDVALVGMRRPEEVERNSAVVDAAEKRFDLVALHHRFYERQ